MAARDFTVTCLCADWCWVCRDYRAGFLALAARFPQADFRWVDIEEAEQDIEVDDFPTIVVAHGSRDMFRGVMRAEPEHLARMLEKLLS